MQTPTIRLFITGGTIDDIDYEKEESAPVDKASFVPSLLRQSRVRFSYEHEI
jgi:hypothetical protein